MPVEIGRPPTDVRRVRFIRNASYGGVDYGPAFPTQIVDVREDWAKDFVRRGIAKYVPAGIPVQPEPEIVSLPSPAEVTSESESETVAEPEPELPKRARRTRKSQG